jgi:outer membrane biosynthesis protein TonB
MRMDGFFLCIGAFLASGCIHAQAKAAPDMPPLEMPAPPPHDVELPSAETPQTAPLVPEPARNAPARPRAAAPPVAEPPKPVVEPPKPVAEPPKPAEEPSRPPSTLQTTPAAAGGEVERAIRATLAHATSDLNRIDVRGLNADARTQYNTAKRFVTQAEEAMRAKNLVFARSVAEKAAALAAQLAVK